MHRTSPALGARAWIALVALPIVLFSVNPIPGPWTLLRAHESQTDVDALTPLPSSHLSSDDRLNASLGPPSARRGHEVVYDAQRGEMILFGGGNFQCPDLRCNDTWAYDPQQDTWTNLTTGNHPGGRWAHAMAYDPHRNRTVMFGGIDPGSGPPPPVPKTWAYYSSSNTWTSLQPASEPPIQTRHDMVYDASSDRFVLYGGVLRRGVTDDTWVYDPGNNTWTNMNPGARPSPRTFPVMVYHPVSEVTILYGGMIGSLGNDETWSYSLAKDTWTRLNPPFAPFPRRGHALSYDPVSGLVILFGGLVTSDPPGRHYDDETWTYDVSSNLWARREPASRPPARSQHAMTYDTQMGRVLLFGGWVSTSREGAVHFNDTWAYDVANDTWTELPYSADQEVPLPPILLIALFGALALGTVTGVMFVEHFRGRPHRRGVGRNRRKGNHRED